MQIVIEISEEAYNLLKSDGVDWLGAEHILSCVEKGKVLPKGHGDLVDKSKIDMSKEWRNVSLSDKSLWIANGILNDVETVIPADKDGD